MAFVILFSYKIPVCFLFMIFIELLILFMYFFPDFIEIFVFSYSSLSFLKIIIFNSLWINWKFLLLWNWLLFIWWCHVSLTYHVLWTLCLVLIFKKGTNLLLWALLLLQETDFFTSQLRYGFWSSLRAFTVGTPAPNFLFLFRRGSRKGEVKVVCHVSILKAKPGAESFQFVTLECALKYSSLCWILLISEWDWHSVYAHEPFTKTHIHYPWDWIWEGSHRCVVEVYTELSVPVAQL